MFLKIWIHTHDYYKNGVNYINPIQYVSLKMN
jgi:hypothetical protein